uniref:Uncharacterized protein n=1 Tax=Megaselia scalaris TaxID=36166 RepID=T1GPI8_MEGSC
MNFKAVCILIAAIIAVAFGYEVYENNGEPPVSTKALDARSVITRPREINNSARNKRSP